MSENRANLHVREASAGIETCACMVLALPRQGSTHTSSLTPPDCTKRPCLVHAGSREPDQPSKPGTRRETDMSDGFHANTAVTDPADHQQMGGCLPADWFRPPVVPKCPICPATDTCANRDIIWQCFFAMLLPLRFCICVASPLSTH